MKTRLKLVRSGGGDGVGGASSDGRLEEERPGTDGFSLRFSGGEGLLRLAGERISDMVTVDLMELAIPRISFPFDITGGIGALRTKRLRLVRLELSLSLEGLLGELRTRLVHNKGAAEPMISFEQDSIGVLASYGTPDQRIPFSFRLIPVPRERVVAFLVDEPRVYGPLPASAGEVVSALLGDLPGVRLDGVTLTPEDPVKQALLSLMPARGWRVPRYDSLLPPRFELEAHRARLVFSSAGHGPPEGEEVESGSTLARLRRMEELRVVRDGDRLLGDGDRAAARFAYARVVDRDPDNPVAASRLAMLDVVDADSRDAALALVREVSRRRGFRSDLDAAMVHGAALGGDRAAEEEALNRLMAQSLPLERLAAGLRLGDLLLPRDSSAAAAAYDTALAARREDPRAIAAALTAAAAAGDKERAGRLISRWIAVHKTPNKRCEAHRFVGEILLDKLGEPVDAARHFERAALLDPADRDVLWGLARAFAAAGDTARAISSFERLERRSEASNDKVGVARCREAVARIWLDQGEPDLAVPRFREAVEAMGEEAPPLWMIGLAKGLIALGQYDEAAMVLEEAYSRAGVPDPNGPWGKTSLELAEVYLGPLGDAAGAEVWIRRALEFPAVEGRARIMLEELLEREGRWEELTRLLERSLASDQSADNAASLARARLRAGEHAACAGTLEAALERFPDRDDLRDLLIEAYRAIGNRAALRLELERRYETCRDPRRRAEMAWELGRLELDDFENPRTAGSWFDEALTEDPDHLGALEGSVAAAERIGDTERLEDLSGRLARELFASGRRPEAAQLKVRLAGALASRGDIRGASAMFREALPDLSREEKGSALCAMGDLHVEAGDYSGARDLFEAARREGGGDLCRAALGSALASLELGDHDRALEAATAAGSGTAAFRGRAATAAARALISLERGGEAARLLIRVAQNSPEDEAPELLLMAARLMTDEDEDPVAVKEVLDEVLELEPEHPEAREAMVELLERAGDRTELARCLVRFAADSARGAADLTRAADFFSADGLHGEAASALREAHNIAPDAETARMLAGALRRSGLHDEMLSVLREYASRDGAVRNMLVSQLEELGRFGELVDVLESRVETDDEKERERLLKLAEIFAGPGRDIRAAIDHIIGAMESGADPGTAQRLAQRAVELAREDGNPMLLARSLEQLFARADRAKRPEILLEMAGAWWRCGEERRSVEALKRAVKESSAPSEGLAALARAHPDCEHFSDAAIKSAVTAEAWREAEALITGAIQGARGARRGELIRQRAAIRRGRLNDKAGAAADLLEANREGVLQTPEVDELIDLLEGVGNTTAAARVAQEVAEGSGRDHARFARAAALKERAGDPAGALALWRKAVVLSPEPSNAVSLIKLLDPARDSEELGRLLATVKGNEDLLDIPDHLAVLEAEVEMELAKGEDLEAVEGLAAMMSLDPSRRDPWRRMVGILERRGEWEALAKRMEERLTLAVGVDDVARTALALGRLLDEKLGDEEGAVAAFERVIAVSPDHREANRALASIAYRRQRWPRLVRHLEVLGLSEGDPEIGLWRAVAAERLGRDADAVDGYRAVLRVDPRNLAALEGFARIAVDETADEEMVAAVSRAVEALGPERIRSSVHRRAARAYLRMGKRDEARRRLEHADRLSGGDSETLALLAEIDRQEGRHEDHAEVLCRLAYTVKDAERARYLADAAEIYLERLFDEKRAYHWLTRAADAAPDEPRVLLGLADCAWAIDEPEVLARSLERYRLVVPGTPLSPGRTYHFAAALSRTGGWSATDIAEMLERVIDRLSPDERESAGELLRELKGEREEEK